FGRSCRRRESTWPWCAARRPWTGRWSSSSTAWITSAPPTPTGGRWRGGPGRRGSGGGGGAPPPPPGAPLSARRAPPQAAPPPLPDVPVGRRQGAHRGVLPCPGPGRGGPPGPGRVPQFRGHLDAVAVIPERDDPPE